LREKGPTLCRSPQRPDGQLARSCQRQQRLRAQVQRRRQELAPGHGASAARGPTAGRGPASAG